METIIIIIIFIICFIFYVCQSKLIKGQKSNNQIEVRTVESDLVLCNICNSPINPDSSGHRQGQLAICGVCLERREKQIIGQQELLKQHDLENMGLMGHRQDLIDKNSKNNNHRYIPSSVRKAVWKRDKQRCVKCGAVGNLQFDHIVPVSRGGSATESNIELLCANCNQKKSDNIE